jgi:hypothetical protein
MAETKNWITVDVVRDHLQMASDALARFTAASFESDIEIVLADDSEGVCPPFESPLEVMFWIWWAAMTKDTEWPEWLEMSFQQPVTVEGANYRLDFTIRPSASQRPLFEAVGIPIPRIAVEVDGHAFHEKTKEQVATRNQRDRALQRDGWIVLHFSWTEMTTQPEACIGEVIGAAKGAFSKLVGTRI